MTGEKKTKIELFEELAEIDENGCSRWVNVNEFVGKYQGLQLLNGAGWSRDDGSFGKKYLVERDKTITPGNKTDAIRTVGFNNGSYSQHIRADIKKQIQNRVMQNEDQRLSDFQPLSKAANDAKRQFCKECKKTGIRYDAKQLGYPMSYYKGSAKHNYEEDACIGCFWYDPIEFRKHLVFKQNI